MKVESAEAGDTEAIAALLERNRDVESLLLQPVDRVAEHIDEFVVVRGASGLHGWQRAARSWS